MQHLCCQGWLEMSQMDHLCKQDNEINIQNGHEKKNEKLQLRVG